MPVPLTADLCAQALVAAARAYGDDPVRAVLAKAGRVRRCFAPAATALAAQTGQRPSRVCAVLGLGMNTYCGAAAGDTPKYQEAVSAAVEAVARELKSPSPVGTVIAPPPVASEEPALPPPPATRVDHTAAICEAMARRRERIAAVPFVVVGVEADKALIGATEPGGCVWPMGDPREPGYRSCQAAPLSGRQYCAEHLKKAGMKPVPKTIATVGRVAESYVDREAG